MRVEGRGLVDRSAPVHASVELQGRVNELKQHADNNPYTPVGLCGFVKRDSLPDAAAAINRLTETQNAA